ncbi:MAG: putative Ig domain-containing protein [Nitrospira sp.]
MEILTHDVSTVAQVKLGQKPEAFNSALQFHQLVKNRFGGDVTYTGHSLGGAEVDYIAARAASEGVTITGVTFGAIGIGAILTAEGINTSTLTGLTNYVHPNDVAKLVGVPVGTQVEVPYTRSVMENIGALFGPLGLMSDSTLQHLIGAYQQSFKSQVIPQLSPSFLRDALAVQAASSNGTVSFTVNPDRSVTAVATDVGSGGLIRSVQTTTIQANGNLTSSTVDAHNNVIATVTKTVNPVDKSSVIVRKNFNLAGEVESEGTMKILADGRTTLRVSGQGFTANNLNNSMVTIQPGAQANINGDGSYILALNNSTVQTTTFPTTLQLNTTNSTLVTAPGGSVHLTNLGSNNNLVLRPNTTLTNLGNNNTIIGPVPPNSTNLGTGNTILSPAMLPSGAAVLFKSDKGFIVYIGEDGEAHVVDGGSDGGVVDGTGYEPGPNPDGGGGGESSDPDPLIDGHSLLISGDLEITVGDGNHSIQGGLGKNVIVAGGGNNAIEALGTENIVVASGGNNLIGVGGGTSTVSVGGGFNVVTDVSQTGVVMAEGNLLVNFGVGNHTIVAGSGPALTDWGSLQGFVPQTGISFANVILGNANFYADVQGSVSNLIIGGPNGNYVQGGLGDNTIYGGDSADQLIGGTSHYLFGGRNLIYGGGGNDVIEGGVGGEADLFGDAGNDILRGGLSSHATLHGGAGNDTLFAASGFGSLLYGDEGDDQLSGGGNVTFDGGAGNDTLIGSPSSFVSTVVFGRGYDHDTFSGTTSRVILAMNTSVRQDDLILQTNSHGDLLLRINGTDDVLGIGSYFVDGTYTITFSDGTSWNKAAVESRTPGLILSESIGGQTLQGSTLADTLSGSGGNHTLVGWGGGDTYLVDVGNGVTSIWDSPDGDNTLVFGSDITSDAVTFTRDAQQGIVLNYGTQGDEVHILNFDPFDPIRSLGVQSLQFFDGTVWDTPTILSRTPGVVLSDTADHAILQGSPLNDTLSGAGGHAGLYGADGSDTYLFDRGHGHVTVFDQDPSGTDLNTVRMASGIAPTDVTLQLSSEGALLLNVAGTTDQVSIANFRQRSFQSFQVSFADGTVWNRDALIAQIAEFPLVADPSGSGLTGSDLSDTLIGLGGDDSLDGLGGNDVMSGGGGNDVYYVEDPGDQVIELPGEGHDVIRSSVDYTLPDNVEALQLSYAEFSGPTPIIGSGNAGNNDLRGNFQNNILQGGAGNDTLWGGYGDTSFGPGNDHLSGGTGNDTYYVDGLAGNGVDTIHDTASPGEGNRLQLGASIRPSDLTFAQSSGSLFIGIGTAGDGVVLDNFDPTHATGSMVLETISFTGGIEQTHGGFDVQLADFLKPAIDGLAGNDVLIGTTAVDIIRGGSGDDTITGARGNDVLIGGSGQDTYVFNLGDGCDLIDDVAHPGEVNRVLFGAGIDTTSLRLEHSGQFNNGLLTLHVGNAGDALQFISFEALNPSTLRAVDLFEFADGVTTTFDQLFLRGVEVRGTAGDDGELFGTFANDTLFGFAGRDSLSGDVGDDTLIGGGGDDFLSGGDGADTYIYNVEDGRDEIEDDREFVLDQDGNSVLANNRILFGEGITVSDIDLKIADGPLFIKVGTTGAGLDLGAFADGRLGIRSLAFNDGLALDLNDLTDALLFTDEDRMVSAGTGNSTVLGGNGNDILTGGDGASVLVGWKGEDVLIGGTGPSKFYGGLGNDLLQGNPTTEDTYVFNRGDGTDTIQDTAGAGAGNRIQFGAGIALGDLLFTQDRAAKRLTIEVGTGGVDVIRLENFTLSGADGSIVAQTLALQDGSTVQLADLLATPGQVVGTSGNDVLTGTSGNDTHTGGTGNDSLAGGAGDDTYVFNFGDGIDSIADTAAPDAGNTLQFGPGITPEDLSLGLGSLMIRVGTTGDAVHLATFNPNDALGSHSIDRFRFADGFSLSYDQLIARGFDLSGTSANDIINGTNVSDRIVGLSGDDSLFGGQGVDTLVGGLGNDTYSVDSLSDVVTELSNEGIDRVLSAVNYTLGSNVENLTLAGGSDINGTGNELNNVLVGNRGNNVLDGGLGADTMNGGAGHDTYVIDDLGDVVTENANEGTDTVRSGLSYTLGENVENLRLVGSANLSGTGNTLDNVLVGNDGNNFLEGGLGNDRLHGAIGIDTMVGGEGNDTYRYDIGDGYDTIEDVPELGEGNRILFGAGITQTDLAFSRNLFTRTLAIQVGTSGTDKLVLTNFDPSGMNGSRVVETLEFADGTTATLVDLLMTPANHAPTVAAPLADQTVLEGVPVSVQVPASTFADADIHDSLTYRASLGDGTALPTWLRFDSVTRIFTGIPDDAEVGSLDLMVTATDAGDLSASDTFTLTIQNVNEAPTVITPLVDQTTVEDALFTFVVPGSIFADEDVGDSLTYSATLASGSALPTWVSFNAATLTFSGTPLNDDVGTLALALTATDAGHLHASTDFQLSIWNVNDAPTLTNPIVDQAALAGEAMTFSVAANTFADVDAGDTLTYAARCADGTALPGWLAFNPTTRTFTGTPGAGDVGVLPLKITATDSGNLSAFDLFDVTVTNPNLVLRGTSAHDVLTGGAGNDQLFGLAGRDTLHGQAGDDLLDGGLGNDTMTGGTGNDTYWVDATGDVVTELVNEGTDTVQSSITYTLGKNVENLTLTATATINGTGNALDNVLIGNSRNNTVTGGAGNDRLDGGLGSDTLVGGLGADTYVVGSGDCVVEGSNAGTDTVQSSITWTLGSNLENLTLTGTGAINGIGNTLNNVLTGNSAANVLSGGTGHDTLDGGIWNDTLVGGKGNDTYLVGRGAGKDRVQDTSGSADSMCYDSAVQPLDLVISRQANHLRLAIHGSSDHVTVENWYGGTTNRIETIQAGNGQTLLSTQVDQLIQAMAALTQQSGLTWDQAIEQRPQEVQAVLAASWQ